MYWGWEIGSIGGLTGTVCFRAHGKQPSSRRCHFPFHLPRTWTNVETNVGESSIGRSGLSGVDHRREGLSTRMGALQGFESFGKFDPGGVTSAEGLRLRALTQSSQPAGQTSICIDI